MKQIELGNEVVVLRGEQRGWVGKVAEIIDIGNDLKDVGIKFENDKQFIYKHPMEDVKLLNDDSFDMESYLTKGEMHSILLRVFTDKAEKFVDEVLKNRSSGGMGGITDQVLTALAEKYISMYFDSLQPYVVNKFKTVIESDSPLVEDEDAKPFGRAIQWKLENAAGKYIDDHKEEIHDLMKDKIHQVAKDMSEDHFVKIISDKVGKEFKKELETLLDPTQ